VNYKNNKNERIFTNGEPYWNKKINSRRGRSWSWLYSYLLSACNNYNFIGYFIDLKQQTKDAFSMIILHTFNFLNMAGLITGIHHITALVDDPQKNLDFYGGILGIRLIKKTINFDSPEVYHLYYGDREGSPGSILTFFPYRGIVKGRKGKGMLNTTSFSVPLDSLSYWENRLDHFGVQYDRPKELMQDELAIYFEDHDGLGLELVFNNKDQREGFTYGHIPIENSIRGFYRVEICLESTAHTASLLTDLMDHQLIYSNSRFKRYATDDSPGNYVDLVDSPNSPRALGGGGTVHHIAFCVADDSAQNQVRNKLEEGGFRPTPIVDRQYFHSIYFREPGGVLFEVATAGPGFLVDESEEHLGEELKLPPWYESRRSAIEKAISPINVNFENFR
jgi:glyoxalase family protein